MPSLFNMLEQYGVNYLHRLNKGGGKGAEESVAIHILTDEDRKQMRRVERVSSWKMAFAGAISAGLSVLAFYLASPILERTAEPGVKTWIEFYSWVGGVTLVATGLEIFYIYIESIRASQKLANIAGLEIFPDGTPESATAYILVRAALELPNPPATDLGLDHHRESSKWAILAATLIYKIKIFATNVIARLIIRRLMGRVVARVWLELIAIPVTAIWNYAVARVVLREARVRTLGPSLAQEFVDRLTEDKDHFSLQAREALLQAVGANIVRTVDPHPNLVVLFRLLADAFEIDPQSETEFDSSEALLANLANLTPMEHGYVIKVLEAATLIDGRMRRREIQLIEATARHTNRSFDHGKLKKLRKQFLDGKPILDRL